MKRNAILTIQSFSGTTMCVDINTNCCRVGMFVSCGGRGFQKLSFSFGRVVNLLEALTLIRILLARAGVEQNPGPLGTTMRVDINTNCCRVGMFVSCGGRGFQKLSFSFGRVVNLLEALTLIRILLARAGVEQNPGPLGTTMCVDINTNCCRVGMFVPCGGRLVQSLSFSFGRVVNLLEALTLIRILLARAGVEQNPGPVGTTLCVDINTNCCRVGMFVPCGGRLVQSLSFSFGRVVNLLEALTLIRILLARAGVEQNPGPLGTTMCVDINTNCCRVGMFFPCGARFIQPLSFSFGRVVNLLEALTLIRILLARAGVEQNPGPVGTTIRVDINTNCYRVGMFVPCGGCGIKSLSFSFGRVVNLLGALTLIRILLARAGVEQNPGPVGTKMVDINTYRCRVGMFVAGGGCGFITFGRTVKLLGSLTLIRILLAMAGVEQNPGPVDKIIFRYQYLLIEVGTDVMRGIFNVRVGNDFGKYLSVNNTENAKLQTLILKKIITADQTQYLPPIDNSPKSSHFDITLLACLLRNVCGLCGNSNAVWKNPAPTDFTLEADLARLKECRNNLQHSGSVFISETDLTDKWNELSGILTRLNTFCGIPNLSSSINDAKKMVVDEELKQHHDQVVKAWADMDNLFDRGIEELKLGQSEIKDGQSQIIQGQSEIKDGQSKIIQSQINLNVGQAELKVDHSEIRSGLFDLKQGQSELKEDLPVVKKGLDNVERCQIEHTKRMQEISNTQQGTKRQIENMQQTLLDCKRKKMDESDLQNHLVKIYKEDFRTLSVSPLCDEDEEEVELSAFYEPPSLYHVHYHRTPEKEEQYSISSYKEIFYKDDRSFRKIYITGDVGVGKTSFCKRMSLLWCKSQSGESVGNKRIQNDIDFMAKFDFVFYVSLGATHRKDVITIIIEQLLCNENDSKINETYELIETILRKNECIVIMDALDEWTPKENGKIDINKLLSDKCIFVTTCRPYKLENERLSPKHIDRQVEITGINKSLAEHYVTEIVKHMNITNGDKKIPVDFIRDVAMCGLDEQLRIPIIASHLVAVWFDHKLTDMSRALIYSSIVDMLLKRAEKRKHIELPSSAESVVQFPDSLSELFYLKKHVSFLNKICLLSFNVLFKQDKCLSDLVFTTEQLESDPYCVSAKEIDLLCTFGVLSKNKVIGKFGKREHKLSYLHKSYLEYFAALFASSFESNNAFDIVVNKWNTINDVMKFENFFLFFVGFSHQKCNIVFEQIYLTISADLNSCRKNAIFHHNCHSYRTQINSLQTMIKKLFDEVSGSNDSNIAVKLEDYIFDGISWIIRFPGHNCRADLLKQLLFNKSCVKSIYSVTGKYFDEFDQIKGLQYLHIGDFSLFNIKFTECMLQNKSTLHTICIKTNEFGTLIPEIPVRSLQHMTSLYLCGCKMQHNSLHNLVQFLSDNVLIENINLQNLHCDNHQWRDINCTLTINLPFHTKLTSLGLQLVNILCNNVNTSRLKSITLDPISDWISSSYIDVLNCIQYSHLEHLCIYGRCKLDHNTMKKVTSTVKTLLYIKSLQLWNMNLLDDVLIQLHPNITQVEIELRDVTMSSKYFHAFFRSLVNDKSFIKIVLSECKVTLVDGETHRELSLVESMNKLVGYMNEYLTSKHAVDIESDPPATLYIEITSCH